MQIHRHHQLEVLLDQLAEVLDGVRADPMVPDVVIVASAAGSTWVEQELARRLGVCANIQVRTWETVESPWSGDRLPWAILAELEAIGDDPTLQSLRQYVAPEHGTRRRVLLAGQIAGVVRRCLDRGRAQWTRPWLATLVERLTQRLGPPPPPPALPSVGRVCLLTPTAAHLGRLDPASDVHLFHVGLPTWAHPLAAATGRVLQDVDALLGPAPAIGAPPPRDTALHRLQADLLEGRIHPSPLDRSIGIHDCHGETRELEVLRDELLRLLRADATLQPRDVLVLCADLRGMAGRIDHVFGQGGEATGFPHLKFDLADRSERAENPVAEALLAVLGLARGRVHASSVLDLLAIDPVRRRFGLDEGALGQVRQWIEAAAIRWGRDAAHRAREHRPNRPDYTWRNGLDRLLLGLATADTWDGVLPVADAEGSNSAAIYGLVACVEALDPILRELDDDAPHDAATWRARAEHILTAMARPAGVHRWQEVRVRQEIGRVTDRLAEGGIRLDLDGFRTALAGRFEGLASAGRFAAGRITFAQLAAHRAVPHRIVALVGMDIDAFPRRGLLPEFDPGDDPPHERDRHAFLLGILAARDALIVTWSGHDATTNAPHPPSVLVSELLDAIGPGFVVEHPLHAWSPDAFDRAEPSLDRLAWQAAVASRRPPEPRRFWTSDLPEQPIADLRLADLIAFLRCPAQHLLQRRLGVFLGDDADAIDDDDPVEPTGLAAWQVRDTLIEAELAGVDRAVAAEGLRLSGALPLGTEGRLAVAAIGADAVRIAERVLVLRGGAVPVAHPVAGTIEGVHLHGRLPGFVPSGRVAHTASKRSDKHRVSLRVEHLAACAFDEGFAGTTHLVALDGEIALPPIPASEARAQLAELVALYREGATRPLPVTFDDYAESYLDLAFDGAFAPDPALTDRILGAP